MIFLSLKNLLILSIYFSFAYGIICPSEKLTLSNFPTLTGNNFAYATKTFDAIYQITHNQTSNYNLIGHRISQVQNNQNAFFDAKEFSTPAFQEEKIIFVSDMGNCLIVESRPLLKVFETSQNRFILSQTVSESDYASAEANEDCSIVRVKGKDGVQKIYKNSKSESIIFPQNSKFDSFYIYGIDNSRKIRKVSADNAILSISLGDSVLENTPLFIENKKTLNALFILTKDFQSQKHTMAIVNTLEDKLVYSRSWSSSSFNGEFLTEISDAGDFVLIRDSNGFLLLLKISFSSLSGLEVKEIELEKKEYVSMLSKDSLVSFTDDAVICYKDKKMAYFQSLGRTLYYLTSLPADLEAEASKLSGLNRENFPVATTYIEPSIYDNCYVGSSGIEESKVKELIDDGEVPAVVQTNNGVVKCQPDCLSCKENGVCLVCALGYSLASNGTCVFCSGCRTCFADFPTTCLSCFLPDVFNPTTNKCESPKCAESLCTSCHLNGTCKKCFEGYSAVNSQCVKCQDGCPSCNKPDTCDTQISQCKLGFILLNHKSKGTDFSCLECATGCLSCSKTDISNCTSCNDGFFGSLNSETNVYRCQSCMENCRSCSAASTCDKCFAGYTTNSAKTKCIERCDSSCLNCSETNKTQCFSCYAGSFLQNSQCIPDLSCNPSKTCTACADGYALVNGECLKCTYSDEKCQGCSALALNVCTKCKLGSYMNANKECLKCQQACTGCQGANACFSCSKGFYLVTTDASVTGKCLQCESQCKTCNIFADFCTSCQKGYILQGSKCISQNHLNYTITVDSPLQMVILVTRTLIQALIDLGKKYSVDSTKPLQLTTEDITISKLKRGSSIISGLMSTFSPQQSQVINQRLTQQLMGINLQNGYSIIGASAAVVTPTTIDQTQSLKQSQPSIGLILGVVIPLAILVIVTVVIVICIIYKRKFGSSEIEDNLDTNEEYFVDESHKPMRIDDVSNGSEGI